MIRFWNSYATDQDKIYMSEGQILPMKFRIAVQTDDMRLYYKLLNLFKKSRLKVKFFTINQSINPNKYDLIITNTNKKATDLPILKITPKDVNSNLISHILGIIIRNQEPRFKQLIIGIDPGEWIGIAAICDGMLLATKTCNAELDQLTISIQDYFITFPSEKIVIRIGDQPMPTSNVIFNKLFSIFAKLENITLEVVHEAFSSSRQGLISGFSNIDESAAITIAKRLGKVKDELLNEEITRGRIKEIQKWSRMKTKNRISLDAELAKLVALKRISLEQAIIQKQKELEAKRGLDVKNDK